jgi:glycosyltransferase involved in cell wall biosynthesis
VIRKILFITTSNLATNPRLVKEIELANSLNFNCTVIQFKLGNWSDAMTDGIKLNFKNTNFIELNATRNPFLPWLFSSLIEMGFNLIYFEFFGLRLTSYSLNKRSILLNLKLNKNNKKYDWIIAHNPGAFFPAYTFSKRTECKLGLDIEDYHPGETNDFKKSQRMLKMMKEILPKANYCSFAAPLIQKELEKDISHESKKWFTILNGFSQSEFKVPTQKKSQKLKIVWFSQNISPGRGLEKFISVINSLHNDIELHLIGDLSNENRVLLLQNHEGIVIHNPISQKELHHFISQFDVGLVADPPNNKNRELAVTNKIIAFAQAGLFIVSVSSFGQNDFLYRSNLNYQIIKYSEEEIKSCLKKLKIDYQIKGINKLNQYNVAQKYAWEEINMPLIEAWNS